MADIKLVITVAPQNDIWPHGNTYPRKAVIMSIIIIMIPVYQVWVDLYEVNIIPREMCMKIMMKNREALFMWIIRISHPEFMSRMM